MPALGPDTKIFRHSYLADYCVYLLISSAIKKQTSFAC